MRPRTAWAALGLAVVAAAVLTLGPAPDGLLDRLVQTARSASDGAGWARLPVIEAAANVLLFVPIAALLAFAAPRVPWWAIVLVGIGVSVLIEIAQAVFLSGRVPARRDVLCNGVGTVIGTATARWVGMRRALSSRL